MKRPLWLFEIVGQSLFRLCKQYILPTSLKCFSFVRSHRLITFTIIIPWLIGAIYTLFIETPIYESTASFVIEKDLQSDTTHTGQGFLSTLNQPNVSQTYLTQRYLLSRDMLNHLQAKYDLKSHYHSKRVDYLSRLEKKPSDKTFLSYYRNKLSLSIDPKTNELQIAAMAFSPRMAKQMTEALIDEAKEFVNRISNAMAENELIFAKSELDKTRHNFLGFKKKVLSWQNKNRIVDPKDALKVTNDVIAKLQANLVDKQTDLIKISTYMQPNASKVVALQEEIDALKRQIKKQTGTLVSSKKGPAKLNKIMTEHDWLKLKLNFAESDFQAAEKSYHAASLQMARKQNALIQIDPPSLPDDYAYPEKLYQLINLLILLSVLCLLIKMSINIIEEHID